MIKIVEIKGGLQELQERRDFPFDKQQSLRGEKSGPGLSEQLRSYLNPQNITREQLEEAMGLRESRSRENEMVVHVDAAGYRVFQEALQRGTTETPTRIEIERRRQREVIRTAEMLRNIPIQFGTSWESANRYAYGVDPYTPSFTEPPIRSIDPETGNTVVTQDSHSATFSRDMTEEQMIAYFDSLN